MLNILQRMQLKKIARKQKLNNIIVVLSSKSKFYFINDLQKPLPSLFQIFNTETNVCRYLFKKFYADETKATGFLMSLF